MERTLYVLALGNPNDAQVVRQQVREINRGFEVEVTVEERVSGRFNNPLNADVQMALSPQAQRNISDLIKSRPFNVILVSDNLLTGLERVQCCVPTTLRDKVLIVLGHPSSEVEGKYKRVSVRHFSSNLDIGKKILEIVKGEVPQAA